MEDDSFDMESVLMFMAERNIDQTSSFDQYSDVDLEALYDLVCKKWQYNFGVD